MSETLLGGAGLARMTAHATFACALHKTDYGG
jgi:hypothetical protein